MRSALCEAVARCQLRRLRATAAAAPLPTALLALAVVLAPVALLRAGRALGDELAPALASPHVVEAVVIGPALAAAVGGAVLALSLPGREALGPELAAGPVDGTTAVLASAVVPVSLGSLAVAPSLLGACVGIGSSLPGGTQAGVALASAVACAAPAGAALAEGAIAIVRGSVRAAAAIASAVVVWVAAGGLLGAPALGTLAPVPGALTGGSPATAALVLAVASGAGIACAWVLAAARRPAPRSRGGGSPYRLVRRRRGAVGSAVAASLVRRSDVRLATAGALAFGLGGVALAASSSAPPDASLLLGGSTALLAAVVAPLVVCGVLVDGRWLWARSPGGRVAVAATATLVGVVAAAAPVAAVAGTTAAFAVPGVSPAGVVAALTVVASATAVAAGAAVPWERSAVGGQMTTVAAFAVAAVGTSMLVGVAGPHLVGAGVPAPLVVGGLCVGAVTGAVSSVALRVERGVA